RCNSRSATTDRSRSAKCPSRSYYKCRSRDVNTLLRRQENVLNTNLTRYARQRLMSGQSTLRASDPYEQGQSLSAKGLHTEAIEQYERALAVRPNDPRVLFALGNTARALGLSAAAEDFFGRVLALEPQRLEAIVNLANLLRARADSRRDFASGAGACRCAQRARTLAHAGLGPSRNRQFRRSGSEFPSGIGAAAGLHTGARQSRRHFGRPWRDRGSDGVLRTGRQTPTAQPTASPEPRRSLSADGQSERRLARLCRAIEGQRQGARSRSWPAALDGR